MREVDRQAVFSCSVHHSSDYVCFFDVFIHQQFRDLVLCDRSLEGISAETPQKKETNQPTNQEKLEYNLQVLSERNKEHTAIQSSYKNRLNRLRETLNTLMSRYNTLDQK